MSLNRLAVRSLRARPLRATLSILGVALGVAVLFAGLATNAGVEASVRSTVHDLVGRADLRVAAFGETGLSPETVAAIAGTPGVAVAAPALEQRTYLGADLAAGDALPPPVTVLGIDPTVDGQLHDLALVDGSPLRDRAEHSALVTERLAAQDGLAVGSPLTMQGVGDGITYRVVGIIRGDGPLTGAFGRTVVVPLATAQQVFGETGVTRVDIGLTDAANATAVSALLESRLKTQPYVLSSPQDLAAALRSSTTDFQATTALIAAIALFAGAFLIFNTLSMTVAERIREVGLLRAAGAGRGQVMSFMLTQALALGVIGSLIGLVLGFLLAIGMVAFVRTVGSITLENPAVPLDAALIALLVGVGVTLAAALEPARRASRIQPVEALRARLDLPAARNARLRWLAAVFVVVALVGVVILPRAGTTAGVVMALAIYAVLLVATLLIPFVLPAVARIAGAPFALVLRFEERLARSSVVRDRSRTALTLGGLTIGLAMIVALGGVGQHARAAAAGWIADVIPGELVLTSIRPISEDEGVEADLTGDVPGVARISPIATFDVALDGTRTDAAAVVGSDMADDGRLKFIAGDRNTALAALDDGGATVIPESLASRLGLTVDQILRVPTADGGLLDLRVAGIVERSIPGRSGESMLVGWSDATVQPGRRRGGCLRASLRPRRTRHRTGRPAQLGHPAGPRGRPARPDRGRDQRRARPDLRTVRRARGGGRPDRRPGHRQHPDHERRRAGPRDRHPPGGRDDPRPGLALGRRGGRRAGACRGAPRHRARARGGRADGDPGRRPARRGERDAMADHRAGARPGRRRGHARGCLSGPPGEPAVHRAGRPVRVTRC